MEQFKTIMQDAQAEIEEKKSRFIANVYYIENAEIHRNDTYTKFSQNFIHPLLHS